ncbi:hypothetical protein K438DRAFT_1786883 [Mycena galopus ATCC 62051]|nr:hypothetical protein K438DRAFT_1786883 [Mycena galopus ATCC 62051]
MYPPEYPTHLVLKSPLRIDTPGPMIIGWEVGSGVRINFLHLEPQNILDPKFGYGKTFEKGESVMRWYARHFRSFLCFVLERFLLMFVDMLDSDEEENLLAEWDPEKWIGQGRSYKNVPPEVVAARHRALQIPSSVHLPPKTMAISALLSFDLPPVSSHEDPVDLDIEIYTTNEPTTGVENFLPSLIIPTRPLLQKIVSNFNQAWFDGNKSLQLWFEPEICYPFWALTYCAEMLTVCEAKDKTDEELALKHAVKVLWDAVGWHGSIRGSNFTLPTEILAKLFSDQYLDSQLIDALLTLLSLRCRDTGEKTLIIGTTFPEFIHLLPLIVDGVPTGSITSSKWGQQYLKTYGTWFQNFEHQELYTVLYRPLKHWTTCSINFRTKQIRYGDGLKWSRPQDFFEGLQAWISEYHGGEFSVTDDLPCADQTDGFNCPIIVVNTVAHNVFGDVLWTEETAKVMRMKAFCDIIQHSQLAEWEWNSSSPTPSLRKCDSVPLMGFNPATKCD